MSSVCVIVGDSVPRVNDITMMRYIFSDRQLCYVFLEPRFYDNYLGHMVSLGIQRDRIFRDYSSTRLRVVRVAIQLEFAPIRNNFHQARSAVTFINLGHGLSSPKYIDFTCAYTPRYDYVCVPGPSTAREATHGCKTILMGNARGEMSAPPAAVARAYKRIRKWVGGYRTGKTVVALVTAATPTYPVRMVRSDLKTWAPRICSMLDANPDLYLIFLPHSGLAEDAAPRLASHPRVHVVSDRERAMVTTIAYVRVCDAALYECTSTMNYTMYDYGPKPIVLYNSGCRRGQWGWYPPMEDARFVRSTGEMLTAIREPGAWFPEEVDKHLARRGDRFASDLDMFKHNLRTAAGM